MKKLVCLIIFLVAAKFLGAQQVLKGKIWDSYTKEPIPFASVLLLGTNKGTYSNENGIYDIKFPKLSELDTIKVWSIGYNEKFIPYSDFKNQEVLDIMLDPTPFEIKEVIVKPKFTKFLGTEKYSKENCSAFIGKDGNWKGEQAAVLANNKPGVTVYLESFGFYIIKNLYEDSLRFRVMLYPIAENGYPGPTFLRRPIIFKTNIKQGEVRVDLTEYDISYTGDFFISLECLEESMEASKFCFAGSIKVPSYFKTSMFTKWGRVKGGGGDFNLKVKYKK